MSLTAVPAIVVDLSAFTPQQAKALQTVLTSIKRNDDSLAAQFPPDPPTFTAGTSLNVGGLGVVRMNYAAPANIVAMTGGVDGQVVTLVNVSGSAQPTLKVHPTGPFWIVGGGDFTFGAGMGNSISFLYIQSQAAWFELSRANPT